ncbi:MAG: caspase family protein [Nitrospirae bacterium]|nr:caspase family protein [Nitrospirota bacterium]
MRTRIGIMLGAVMLAGVLAGCASFLFSSPLQKAAVRGDLQAVRTLMDQGAGADKEHLTDAYINAAGAGQLQMVQFFLEKGVDLETRGTCDQPVYNMGGGFTNVSMPGATALICAAGHGEGRVVQFLLDRNADVNAKSDFKWTALQLAAYLGHGQIAKLLLDRGAEDISGALKFVRQYNRHPEVIRLLEQAEARQLGTAPPVVASTEPEPTTPTLKKRAQKGGRGEEEAPPPMAVPPAADMIAPSDVDTLPAMRAKARANAYAVVVGIEQYQQKLPKADFAAHDAEIMGQYLTKTLGYAEENVVVLLNDRATKTGVEKYIEGWLPDRVEKDDSVFIYFSGHGAPNPKTGKTFLVPYDGDPAFVDQTGYPLDRLYDRLSTLPAKEVVVMLDSCFSGAGGRSVIAKGMRPMVLSVENPVLAKGKVVVLAASSGAQVSSTYDQKNHGLLTYFFLKGLRGEADRNQDGRIELAEVFEYLKPQVERTARREFHNEQTPQLLGSPDLLAKDIRLVERAER